MSNGPDERSSTAVGGGGTIGVNVLVAVWPTTSVTRYVIGVFVPDVIDPDAANVTTPVDWFNVQVPSPGMVTDVPHVDVAGSTMHVAPAPEVTNPVPVARPEEPVTVVNVAVSPASTSWVCGVAAMDGGLTVGVIVALSIRLRVSATWYVTGVVTVPLNVGSGSNVTDPSVFTV